MAGSTSKFQIKEGDLLPALESTLTDQDGVAVDLTGGTLQFRFSKIGVDGATTIAAATIVTAVDGKVSYTFTGTQTDTPGEYEGEFIWTSSGSKQTFPSRKVVRFTINAIIA